MDLNKKSKEFVDAITETNEFNKLKEAKAIIDKNKDLKRKVDDFRKKQVDLYKSKKSQRDIEYGLIELNKNFKNLSQISEVDAFLKSMKEFNDMMYNVFKNINDSIDSKLNSK